MGWLGEVVRALGHLLAVMLGTASLAFVVPRLTGDPAMMVATPGATLDDLAAIRRDLGLDRSIAVQCVEFLRKLAVGDLAESSRYRRPALEIVTERAGATVQLALAAQFLAIVVAIPLGVLSAIRRDTWLDAALTGLATLGQSIPHFWLGLMAIVVFAVHLGWLESSLSFLGLGVQPPTPSWGMDLSESRQFLQIAYWTVLFPGLAISLVVLAANLVGDWVRDVLDPIVKRNRAAA